MRIDHFGIISRSNPYFIAEAGVNHNGDVGMALDLVDVAADAGADAIKFQTFSADRLVTKDATKPEYQKQTGGVDSQYDLLKRYEFDRAVHERIQNHCRERGITFLSTPFDEASADMLMDLGVPAFKVGSGELDNFPLLRHIAQLGKPMIVSTGMGTMDEVHSVYKEINSVSPDIELAFLHCTSAYPCKIEDVNLRAMETMLDELKTPVGYSDHTTTVEMPAFAVSAGAVIVEKHFTLDSSLEGPDHAASLEPGELKRAVELVDVASRALGDSEKAPTASEQENMVTARKSLHAAQHLPKGAPIQPKHVNALRPSDGLSPRYYDDVIGVKTRRAIEEGEAITLNDLVGLELDSKEERETQ